MLLSEISQKEGFGMLQVFEFEFVERVKLIVLGQVLKNLHGSSHFTEDLFFCEGRR